MKWLDFDPHITFLKLKAVVYVIATIFVLAAIVTLTIICATSGLKFNFSSEGWNSALDIFKVPLGLLAVAIPLVALLAANHRSVQSKAQMELTQSQIKLSHSQIQLTQNNNYITNYYKHVDEFQKYLDNHHFGFGSEKEGRPKIVYPRKLHKTLFPQAKMGILTIDKELVFTLQAELKKILSLFSVFEVGYYDKRFDGCNSINRRIDALARKYHIFPFRLEKLPQFVYDGETLKLGPTIRQMIRPLGTIATILNEAMLFDETYDAPEILRQLTTFNFDLVPDELPVISLDYHFHHHFDQETQLPQDEDQD